MHFIPTAKPRTDDRVVLVSDSQYSHTLLTMLAEIQWHRVKKNQLDAQLILSIFLQPLHVSGVSRPIIRRYNRMYTTIGTFFR